MGACMKKPILFTLLFVLTFSSNALALTWAYPFVVWEGKVYEVMQEDVLPESDIGEAIGHVETAADDMTGDYYGNASNYYEKGTAYYALKGISSDEAIAVETGEGGYVKAEYIHRSAFHFMNILTAFWFWASLAALTVFAASYIYLQSRKIQT